MRCPAALPYLSRRPAGRRAALSSPRAALCSPTRHPFASRAPPFAARPSRHLAARSPPLAARAPFFAPVRRPAAARPAARSPTGQRPAARRPADCAALLIAPPGCCPPCYAQPCWLAPSCPRRPAAARPAGRRPCSCATVPACRPAGRTPPFSARYDFPPPFDHEGRPIQFDTWLDYLQLYLLSDSRDSVSLFDHTFGASLAPPAIAHSVTHSQWLIRDAAAHLAVRNHLPLAEHAHFGQHKTAKALYDAVITRYSSPATAALVTLVPRMSGLLLLLVGSGAAARARVARVVAVAAGVVVVEAVEAMEVADVVAAVGVVAGVGASVAVVVAAVGVGVAVVVAVGMVAAAVVAVGVELFRGEVLAVAKGSRSSVRVRPLRPSNFGLESICLLFKYDAILAAMYALSVSSQGECYLRVPPNPSIEAAALGASESALPGTAPAEDLHTFTIDSGASHCFFRDSTNLTPLPAFVMVRLADPSEGPVLARSSILLPYPAVPSGSLSGLHLPSFSMNLVFASGPVAAPCSCRFLSHQTLLWHHRLGHPSLPRLRGMHSPLLVSGLPRSLPPLLPSPAPPCLPCVEGRQRAAPHSSSFPLTSAPLQTSPHGRDLPVLRLHSDRGGEFSSDLLQEFCRGEGILQLFTLPVSSQRNGVAERRIGLVMEVARTSMIHAGAPHFLWPFVVRRAAHQLNLWPRVSLPETLPTLHWTGKVGDSVTFYRLFPYCIAPLPPPPLFLAPGPPPVDALPPQGPAPSGVSQVDPLPPAEPVEVAMDSGSARGAASGGAGSRSAASGGAEPASAEPGGAEPEGAEPGGAESKGAESGGAEPEGAEPGGTEPEGAEPGGTESEVAESRVADPKGTAFAGGPGCTRLRSGAAGAGGFAAGGTGARRVGATILGGTGVIVGARGTGGVGAAGPGGSRTRGSGAAGVGGFGGTGSGDPGAGDPGAGGTGARGVGAEGARAGDPGTRGVGNGGIGAGGAEARRTRAGDSGVGGTSTGGTGAGGTGAIVSGAGGAGAGGAGAGGTGAGGTVQRRPFFVPPPSSSLPPLDSVLRQVLSLPLSTSLTPRLLCPPPHQLQPQLQPDSPLPAPSPYAEQTDSLTERREPESRPSSPFRAVRTGRRVPRPRPPSVPGNHIIALPRAARPTVPRLLATVVSDPSFESTAVSALVAELVDFAAACRLNYATALVAESKSDCPPSVGG
ncbi:unnamed protein product [Closterium sp. NIES-53]